MGQRCFLVAMLIVFCGHSVFGRDCSKILNQAETNDCSECIRCGGYWCNDPREDTRCVTDKKDSWCPENLESFDPFQPTLLHGNDSDTFNYRFVEKRASVGATSVTDWKVRNRGVTGYGDLEKSILNSTQSSNVLMDMEWISKSRNQFKLFTTIGEQFCSENSTQTESVYIQLTLPGLKGEAILKYRVPCACQCEELVEKASPVCSGYGNLTCGVCHCESGRSGKTCSEGGDGRGDLSESCKNPATNLTCSGNGVCKDKACECFNDINIEGSHYFDRHSFCEDICTTTSNYTNCLQHPEPGVCALTNVSYVTIENLNDTSLDEMDEEGRRVWVRCNVTLECGPVQYAARRKDGEEYLVVLKHCDGITGLIAAGRPVTVPVVFTVLALVVAAAAAAGYVFWKARGPPSPPLNESGYTNVDAEECVGENPLYKPPTSSFKNPMYGKC